MYTDLEKASTLVGLNECRLLEMSLREPSYVISFLAPGYMSLDQQELVNSNFEVIIYIK